MNHRREFRPEKPEIVEEMQHRAHQCIKAIDEEIGDKMFIAGDFSGADIMLGYTFYLADKLAPFEGYDNARRYWESLKQRPAAQKTLAR